MSYGPQSLTYLLSGSLQKKFDYWYMLSYLKGHILKPVLRLCSVLIINSIGDLSLCSSRSCEIFFQQAQSPSLAAPGPLHRLVLLPGMILPQIPCQLHPVIQFSALISPLQLICYPCFHHLYHIIPFCSFHSTTCNSLANLFVCLFNCIHVCICLYGNRDLGCFASNCIPRA